MGVRVPQQASGLIVTPEEASTLQEQGYEVDFTWGGPDKPWNAPQLKILTSTADEILAAGGKGGGKSEAARAFLIGGNPDKSSYFEDGTEIPWNISYSRHPHYHGLVLRKNQEDLDEFIAKAAEMYKPHGGMYISGQFRFPSGAVIDLGHMRDKNSWQKYLGIEYQRIVIDEAALIPDFASYEQLRTCLRTTHTELRCQMLLTSNANGPGVGWITERFMNAHDINGNKYSPGELIEEWYEDPDTGEKFKQTRIWIFSTYKDNPHVMKTQYGRQLATITDEKMRRAYLDGDWYALFGSFFGDLFRPVGPRQGEDTNANHVVKPESIIMQPFWHRSIAMDWGYAHESAIYWGCQEPNNGRLVVYRELVADQTSPERLGYEIALASRDELEQSTSKSMILHLSHDAFSTRAGARTIAELVYAGMVRVLGRNAVHVPDILINNLMESYEKDAYSEVDIRRREQAIEAIKTQKRIGITIRKADKTSVIGWQHCRELMRWKSVGINNTTFDADKWQMLVKSDLRAAAEYAKIFRNRPTEILPKLQILDTCPRLIAAIPAVQHEDGTENVDKKHFKGRDSVDSFCYLVMGVRDEDPKIPKEYYMQDEMSKILAQSPDLDFNSRVHVARALEEEWGQKNKPRAPFTPIMGPASLRKAQRKRIDMLQYEFKA